MLTVTDKKSCPSFGGMTSILSKNFHKTDDILEIYKKEKTRTSGIVGTLPPVWIKKIPLLNNSKKEGIKEIFKAFTLAAVSKHLYPASAELSTAFLPVINALKKCRIINSEKDFSVKYLASGINGDVYKVSVNNENFAFKSFYSTLEKRDFGGDGNFAEQAAALFINRNFPNKNWAKFYFGDLTSGTMFSAFSSYENRFTGKAANLEAAGIITGADNTAQYNVKGGRCVDFGQLGFLERATKKTYRYIYKKALRSEKAVLEIAKETLKWKKSQFAGDRLQGCLMSLDRLEPAARKKILNIIMPVMQTENAIYLSKNLSVVPSSVRLKLFRTLSGFNNPEIDLNIAENLLLIPKPQKPFKELAEKENPEINTKLAEYLYILTPAERIEYFKKFINMKDKKLNEALAGSLVTLPAKAQTEFLHDLLKDKSIMKKMFKHSSCLSAKAINELNSNFET